MYPIVSPHFLDVFHDKISHVSHARGYRGDLLLEWLQSRGLRWTRGGWEGGEEGRIRETWEWVDHWVSNEHKKRSKIPMNPYESLVFLGNDLQMLDVHRYRLRLDMAHLQFQGPKIHHRGKAGGEPSKLSRVIKCSLSFVQGQIAFVLIVILRGKVSNQWRGFVDLGTIWAVFNKIIIHHCLERGQTQEDATYTELYWYSITRMPTGTIVLIAGFWKSKNIHGILPTKWSKFKWYPLVIFNIAIEHGHL